jgi:hypothetical protein
MELHVPDQDMRRDTPACYRICLAGVLDSSWSDMLAGMTLSTEATEDERYITTLRGRVVDQAALMGVLNLVYDLGMPVLLVECDPEDAPCLGLSE